ncbi:unnamed protein product, partial [Amoebophrya sp. A25]|eukprot:GSA25T00014173001.1
MIPLPPARNSQPSSGGRVQGTSMNATGEPSANQDSKNAQEKVAVPGGAATLSSQDLQPSPTVNHYLQ